MHRILKHVYLQLAGAKEFNDTLSGRFSVPNATVVGQEPCKDKSVLNNRGINDEATKRLKTGVAAMMGNYAHHQNTHVDVYFALPASHVFRMLLSKTLSGHFFRGQYFKHRFENAIEAKTEATEHLRLAATQGSQEPAEAAQARHIDKHPEFRPHLVSTNLSMFGNEYDLNRRAGESTFHYFLTAGTQLSLSTDMMLRRLLFDQDKEHIDKQNDETLMTHLVATMNKYVDVGCLVQVLLPREHVDTLMYLSYEYGKPADMLPSVFFSDIKGSLAQLSNKVDDACVNATTLQARLVMSKRFADLAKNDAIRFQFLLNRTSDSDFISDVERCALMIKNTTVVKNSEYYMRRIKAADVNSVWNHEQSSIKISHPTDLVLVSGMQKEIDRLLTQPKQQFIADLYKPTTVTIDKHEFIGLPHDIPKDNPAHLLVWLTEDEDRFARLQDALQGIMEFIQ